MAASSLTASHSPQPYGGVLHKTTISARTNRTIGGAAPSAYLPIIETRAQIKPQRLDELITTHRISAEHLGADDFDTYFAASRVAVRVG